MSDLLAHLGEGRAQAESRFTESFDFFTTTESVDPVTFDPIQVKAFIKRGVRGRLKTTSTLGRDVEAGAQFPVVTRLEVHVAVGVVDAPPGVFVQVISSTADASVVGRVYRVSDRPSAGQVTSSRFPVEELS